MKILIASNSFSCPFGYSRVFSPIAVYLQKQGHSVTYFDMQMIHPPFKDENLIQHCGLRYAPWGQDVLSDLLRMYRIDVLITGHDLFMPEVSHIPDVAKSSKVQWVAHVTINHSPVSPFLIKPITEANCVVVPSRFGLTEMRRAGFVGPDTIMIPHGFSPEIFYPLPKGDKQDMRKRLKVEDKFVCLTTQRNKGGVKAFPRLFYAWKLVCENVLDFRKKSVLLILADPKEPEGILIEDLRNRIGMQNEIKFIWMKPSEDGGMALTFEGDPEGARHTANYGFSSDWMAKLYNIADVHVISSGAESFNLPCLESQACGVPQIFPNAHVGPELVGGPKSGLLIAIKDVETIPLLSDISNIDVLSLASCIRQLYEDESLRKELGGNALENAKKYSWDLILPKWAEVVERFGVPPVSYQTGVLGI